MHEILNCSMGGDKRFSSLYAKVRVNGVEDTIDRHIQSAKRFTEYIDFDYQIYRFKKPDYFVVKGKKICNCYFEDFVTLLWYQYFKENIELFYLAKTYKKIEDPFSQYVFEKSVVDILNDLIKYGFPVVYSKTKDFRDLLKTTEKILSLDKNIFSCNEDVIVVEVNCQGITNNSVYNELVKKYPFIKTHYRYVCKNKNPEDLLGNCIFFNINKKTICLMFSQFYYSRNKKIINISAFRECLLQLKNFLIKNKKSIALPYGIGCNDSLLEWNNIENIILDTFNDYPLICYKK